MRKSSCCEFNVERDVNKLSESPSNEPMNNEEVRLSIIEIRTGRPDGVRSGGIVDFKRGAVMLATEKLRQMI